MEDSQQARQYMVMYKSLGCKRRPAPGGSGGSAKEDESHEHYSSRLEE